MQCAPRRREDVTRSTLGTAETFAGVLSSRSLCTVTEGDEPGVVRHGERTLMSSEEHVMTPRSVVWSLLRRNAGRVARSSIQKNEELWTALSAYLHETNSTGCSYIDYWELYRAVRTLKPQLILECGTGVSTVVIAQAVLENAREGVDGRIISMEEMPEYYEMARRILPSVYAKVVEIRLSPVVEDTHSLFRGVRYRDVPKMDYDFAFIDGPNYKAPSDGMLTFDFDFIHAVKNSSKPLNGLVDKRVSTCYVLQKIFGTQKVRYDGVKHLGTCVGCSADDVKDLNRDTPSLAFADSFRLFGNSRLDFFLS